MMNLELSLKLSPNCSNMDGLHNNSQIDDWRCLAYYALSVCKWFPTSWRNVVPLYSRLISPKRITFDHLTQNMKAPWYIIIPLKSQYIFSLLLFVAKNRDLCESNSEIHNINTRFSSDLHTATANLTTFQKGPFYFGIKVF
jgi:hypothetical protein